MAEVIARTQSRRYNDLEMITILDVVANFNLKPLVLT
jgi:hypothetical protein